LPSAVLPHHRTYGPRIRRNDSPAYVRHIYAHELRCKYWTSSLFALLSIVFASYVISVRRTSALPSASFRFHLAMDTPCRFG
jgi:hypothetical protein